jgi:hypothetical protein
MAILIALFLMSTIAVTLVALPVANAHTPPWNIPTFAFVSATPNPVGVGQQAIIVFWIDKAFVNSAIGNDIRPHDYKLTITKPDGTKETMNWPYVSDPTSSQYTLYTPDQVGTYTLKFDYAGQTYTWSGTYQNDTYLPSTASTTLTVQQEPVAGPPSYPLPTEYWTRPIEGQNTGWWTVSSNWLGSSDYVTSGSPQIFIDFQPDGTAPNSAHIMWTKPVNDGGVVGGSDLGRQGNVFYTGSSYNERFAQPIIMNGRLFYELPYGNSATGGGFICVDLRTGERLWWANTTGIGAPSFGYYYSYDSPNQHGVLPNGLLFTSNFARSYDPSTGIPTTMNITSAPSASPVNEVYGPSGEHLRYIITNLGNATRPNYYLAQWNSSKVFGAGTGLSPASWYSGTVNASLAVNYDWNITVPWLMSGATIVWTLYDDLILGRNGSLPTVGSWTPYTMWALSLKSASRGQMLWMKTYEAPPGNVTVLQGPLDEETRVFALVYKETMQWIGYSLDDGRQLWGPTPHQTDFDYYQFAMIPFDSMPFGKVAYGKLYSSAYGGICYCYDMKNGSLLWTYGNGGPGNSSKAGTESAWPNWPMFIFAIADGKLYLGQGEHSANTPLYKDELVRCIDAYTGKEIWTIMGFSGYRTRSGMAVADGFMVYCNHYDMQIYCFGKGPSSATVESPLIAITAGDTGVIQGTVMDIASGTNQPEQAARFPNGVPAVSDDSMTAWMEYVYMQKPRPTNATGVEVTLDAVDPNGNFVHLGTVTSDTSGTFGYAWTTPDIPGKYTIIATFAGSDSYWPSYAETYAFVSEAPPSPTPTPAAVPPPDTTLTIIGMGIAIIIAVALAAIWIRRK